MPAEQIPAADIYEVMVEQFAYLVATVKAGRHSLSEFERLMRVREVLLEPLERELPRAA